MGWAAYGGHAHICKILIEEYQADFWAKNVHGQTAMTLAADPTHPKWAGIWPSESNQGIGVKVVTSENRRSTSRVLLKVPTIGKTEAEEDLEEFTQEIEQNYVVKPRRAPGTLKSITLPWLI